MKQVFFFFILLVLSSTLAAGDDNAGAFIENGLSPHAAALGMSHTALASGSDAVYWNAAGLANTPYKGDFSLLSTRAFETDFLAFQYASKINNWGIGTTLIQATVDDIFESQQNGLNNRYEQTGTQLSYQATAYYLGAGRALNDRLSVGASTKVIQERAAGYKATGSGLDLGATFQASPQISIGVNAQNLIKPNLKWNTPSENIDTVPQRYIVGVSAWWLDQRLLTTTDIRFRHNRQPSYHYGLGYQLTQFFAVRGGLNQGNLSLGLGLDIHPLQFNFAWVEPGLHHIDDIYRFSVGYRY